MNRRMWNNVLAGVLAATVLVAVAGVAYRAGRSHEVVTRTVGEGQVVRVIDGYGYGWGHGPGFGFLLFPLLGFFLVLWLMRGRRGGWNGGAGGGCGAESFEERHRRAHGEPVDTGPARPPRSAEA